jgi:isoleucyl-tRNA synthetase
MLTNSQPWDNLKYDEAGVQEVQRSFFGKLYQTYSFLAMYANVDGWHFEESEIPMSQRSEMDRWILSSLNSLIRDVELSYENYEPTRAGRLIQSFVIDNVSNWFVRLSRKRFWGGEMSIDKLSAYQTLYTCLETVSRLMAPIAPFYADQLYRDLHSVTVPEGSSEALSVHLATFPVANDALIDKEQESRMALAQEITSMVLSLRKKEQIIVRQPLARIAIPAIDRDQQLRIEAVKQLILDEVNVKALEFVEGAGLLTKKVKCNFRTMGKKFGKLMKDVNAAVTALSQEQIAELETGHLPLTLPTGDAVTIDLEDVEIFSEDIPGWTVANDGALTVALDITVTDELRNEGFARELIKRIQNLRKESGFEITDLISIQLEHNEHIDRAVEAFGDYITSQVLADGITIVADVTNPAVLDFDDFKLNAHLERI